MVPNTGGGGLDCVTVALLMAALQAVYFSGADRDDLDLPIISGHQRALPSGHEQSCVANCIILGRILLFKIESYPDPTF